MLVVRCKSCNKELIATSKLQVCGCPNKLQLNNNKITAVDLSQVIMVEPVKETIKKSLFSAEDLAYQEARRQRKVKKLNFEIR